GNLGLHWHAPNRPCALCMARAPELWQWLAVCRRLRYSDRHRIRSLLCRRGKAAGVGELDSRRGGIGAAVACDSSCLAWEKDKVSGASTNTWSPSSENRHRLTGQFPVAQPRLI